MYLLLLLFLCIIPVKPDCYDYAMSYKVGDPSTISLDDREDYVPKMCDTIRFCHSDPQLFSYEVYVDDVSRCYRGRMYNFDLSVLNNSAISSYISLLTLLERAKIRLDTQTAMCKDAMTATVESVRLRQGYMREFQYSRSPRVSGDVLLLLKNERAIFEANVKRQLDDVSRMENVSKMQYDHIGNMLSDIEYTHALIDELATNETVSRVRFHEAEWEIQKNVIGSLLEITN
jgi:hypothetical protein